MKALPLTSPRGTNPKTAVQAPIPVIPRTNRALFGTVTGRNYHVLNFPDKADSSV